MYKVFINEKKLLLSKQKVNLEKSFSYKDSTTLEMAIDRLNHTSCKAINIYGDKLDEIWKAFKKLFKNIDAGGGIVSNNKNEILFIKRLGRWDLPKGKKEKGEQIEQTSVREVAEETGIDKLKIRDFIGCTYHAYKTKKNEVLKTTYWYDMFHDGNQKGTPQQEEGITEIDWKSKKQIKKEVIPNTFNNIQLILEEYQKSIK
ncbi:MAG: NUDIX hydrolase [Flavobacteriales bacterium]|nr:MAG: NUDIX hydrolase [Flavobacteriales bacterium]